MTGWEDDDYLKFRGRLGYCLCASLLVLQSAAQGPGQTTIGKYTINIYETIC